MISVYKRLVFFLAAVLLFSSTAMAQDKAIEIKGVVTETNSAQPIAGASVQVKGTIAGTITNEKGEFTIVTKEKFPVIVSISYLGYEINEMQVSSADQQLFAQLKIKAVNTNDVVVTASRIEEGIMQSPVSIEKMDARCIRETPSPTFYDAIEGVKGVQMTTVSLGMKVPNTRGFSNTTNARFLQMIDGADSQAPGLGVSIANTVGPSELDVQSVEITPGASSALYGMNALNGISNFLTKDPFVYQGLSIYQRTVINHVNSNTFGPQPFTESALRYAKAFKDKFAFKVNIGYMRGKDWVADDATDINPSANASTNLVGENNPAKDPINSYGNESGNRTTLTLADGKRYELRRTGYFEKDFADYKVENLKFDVGLYYRINEKLQLSYTGRAGFTDAVYQRGNRIKLDDYWVHQHKLELKGVDFTVRAYTTFEYSDKSYNMRPMGENLDRSFKTDTKWFNDYKSRYNSIFAADSNVVEAHNSARVFADSGRWIPGTKEFEQQVKKLAAINNWDSGAQLYMKNLFYQAEGQYNFTRLVKYFDLLAGVDFRDFIIRPDGNSFINPDTSNPFKALHYWKVGGFVQASKTLFKNRLKLIASVRVDKYEYFKPSVNPRVAIVISPTPQHNIRFSYQNGYRFPTLFEGFSAVNNGGVIRYGGLELLTGSKRLFENSYLRTTVDEFQKRITADVNSGISQDSAIRKNAGVLTVNPYTYLKPERINAFEFGYKGSFLKDKLFLDLDFYYNIYKDFIDQVEIAVPNSGTIGQTQDGVDSTTYAMSDKNKQTRYRMWTNALSEYHNLGTSIGVSYNFWQNFTIGGNYSYSKLIKVDAKDFGLETSFNTPAHIVNLNFGNRNVYKNLGFNIAYRWQSAFEWKSPLANGTISAYHALDAQISYKVPKIKAMFKLGGTNLVNTYYTQYVGGPAIGGMYYLAVSFDGLFQ
ncbi:MAG TPA: TonB-dependent receptor [Chitinophagales bacterium]|nr:TonB-dependent receptor [Chitinophagales bacterium]